MDNSSLFFCSFWLTDWRYIQWSSEHSKTSALLCVTRRYTSITYFNIKTSENANHSVEIGRVRTTIFENFFGEVLLSPRAQLRNEIKLNCFSGSKDNLLTAHKCPTQMWHVINMLQIILVKWCLELELLGQNSFFKRNNSPRFMKETSL